MAALDFCNEVSQITWGLVYSATLQPKDLQVDPRDIIADWKQRLTAVADNPAYDFEDTPQHLIDQHYRRLTQFVGYSESELSEAELRLKIKFPAVFREFMKEMGQSPGELLDGGQLAKITEFKAFRAAAMKMMAKTDPTLTLPHDAVVFYWHERYAFIYLRAIGGIDGQLTQWTDLEADPWSTIASFVDFVEVRLQGLEEFHAGFRQAGGYELTLNEQEEGTQRSHLPE